MSKTSVKKLIAELIERIKIRFTKKTELSPRVSISEAFQSATSGTGAPIRSQKIQKPKAEKYYPYALAVIVGFFLAELGILSVRPFMIPKQAPPPMSQKIKGPPVRLIGDYRSVLDRNMFNSDGVIPPPLMKDGNPENLDNSVASLSQLPLVLVGTIVHINPAKSVAAIQNKSSSAVIPYLPNDEIEGMATLIKVERGKAIFRNSRTGHLEYIEIPNESKLTFSVNKTAPVTTASGITKTGQTDFTLRREDLNKHLKNLPELLQQARAVPNIIPGTSQIDGFKLVEVQPNSIYTDLGLGVGDVIKQVNGQKVDSPARAMELYNQLKTESRIELTVNRDGQDVTNTYNVQ